MPGPKKRLERVRDSDLILSSCELRAGQRARKKEWLGSVYLIRRYLALCWHQVLDGMD